MKKTRPQKDHEKRDPIRVSKPPNMKNSNRKKTNMAGGLSLEAFANSKSHRNHYNLHLIKKQREVYKNAKYVKKFKKSLKMESQQSDFSTAIGPHEDDDMKENTSDRNANRGEENTNERSRKKPVNKGKFSLGEMYERKRKEKEKARLEREAIIKEKNEKREAAEARRKTSTEKMRKKTRSGQPVMKYRIEKLLESIQGSQSK